MITGCVESRSSGLDVGVFGGEIDGGRGGSGGKEKGSKFSFIGGGGAGRTGEGGNLKLLIVLSTLGVSTIFDVNGITKELDEVIDGISSLSVIDNFPLFGDGDGTGGSGISKNSSSVESPPW